MTDADRVFPSTNDGSAHLVSIQPSQPICKSIKATLKKTLDDLLRQFKNESPFRRVVFFLVQLLPILGWAPRYNLQCFKADLIAGIIIASVAIPQGISYDNLLNLPSILGLYSSFVPPLVYAVMGSSTDMAVGSLPVAAFIMDSMLRNEVMNASDQPKLYLQLIFTATFFAGVFQAALGFFRLGFIVDFLSRGTLLGFMAGAATLISLQQLKGILGFENFTSGTDLVSISRSIFSQSHLWNWESCVLGYFSLVFLIFTTYFRKTRAKYFWVSTLASLTAVILGSFHVSVAKAETRGVRVIRHLHGGLNFTSLSEFTFPPPYLKAPIKTGIIAGVIAVAEGIAAGRRLAMSKPNSYHIDGTKEIIAIGSMNIAGSFFSCNVTTGSRSTLNSLAGCKTPVSNIVMATIVMITLLFLTPLFHCTPLVIFSIKMVGMFDLIDYEAGIHLWKVDKFEFIVGMSAYIGVVFGSVEIGLLLPVAIFMLRVLLFIARPNILVLGKMPNSMIYRSVDRYPDANSDPGVLILQIDAPIYFADTNYLRERILRWIDEDVNKPKSMEEAGLQHVVLDMGFVSRIDMSGISMLEEVKKNINEKGIKLVLANPGGEVMKLLAKSELNENMGQEWIYLTVGEAVEACKQGPVTVETAASDNNV